MKGYVYMINYKESKDDFFGDQVECEDKKDLLIQLKYLAADGRFVDCVKLVLDKDRYIEKDVSKSLAGEVKRIMKENYA